MYMYAIFRSMGLIEVIVDAATCICVLSSEAKLLYLSTAYNINAVLHLVLSVINYKES